MTCGFTENGTAPQRRQERGHQVYALRLLGDIAARREPLESEQAGDAYRQAFALAKDLGMRPLAAHCHRSLGELYVRLGRRDDARVEYLGTASIAAHVW
jgi:hypothetical protein